MSTYNFPASMLVVGFICGMLTICLAAFQGWVLVAGLLYGALVGAALVRARVLRNEVWAWFTLAAIAAYFLSPVLAGGVQLLIQMNPEQERNLSHAPLPLALAAGGAFGGLVLIGTLSLVRHETKLAAFAARLLVGGVAGGALGVLGWQLSSSLGTALWQLLHAFHLTGSMARPQDQLEYGDANFVYSLHVVWETGMAFVMALIVRRTHIPDLPILDP
jgi:hypothetical protein